jgi:DNA gyrase subunit A
MATNMAPHNLTEVIAAARHLIKHPNASLETLMRYVPGPDLPTGGLIVGLDGIREAYETGRGIFRTRAKATIEQGARGKSSIVVTELPYTVGPEKLITRIKDLVQAKKLNGISDLKDLTDRNRGLHVVIEVRSGFNPEAVLVELYRLTPMEETFGINNVALVDGQPRVLGLKELLTIYVDHRIEVTRRRTEFRRRKRQERLHLVDGIIVALLNIDEVIAVIRSSDDAAQAKTRLMETFELSEVQAQYILDTPLRRLTRYDRLELEREQETLRNEIAELTAILDSEDRLREVVSDELADIARRFGTPRRTVLLEGGAEAVAAPLEVADDPVQVLLSATGRLGRIPVSAEQQAESPPAGASRANHDALVCVVRGTARGTIGVVTSAGRMVKLNVLEIPSIVISASAPSLAGGTPLTDLVTLERGETVVTLAPIDDPGEGLALGTADGVVKRVAPDYPANRDDFELITLKDGDRVVGAAQVSAEDAELVFITSDAQLLHFPAATVRPQGRPAGGMAGIRLTDGAAVVWFGVVAAASAAGVRAPAVVVTVAGASGALPGTGAGSVKVTPMHEYPGKGRATGGVRCHRFLKGEDALVLAWAGPSPALGTAESGKPVALPDPVGRRDGSGEPLSGPLAVIGG